MDEQDKLGAFPYVLGGISYVPMIGILFGIIAIIWGLTTKKVGGRRLALIGVGGIAFSIAVYSTLFYFGSVKRGGVFDELGVKLAESTITSLVESIEFYKTDKGHYPDSLETLKKSQPMVMIYDPSDVERSGKPRLFYYKIADKNHYYLLGVGLDGKPFTKDDIVPKVAIGPGSKVGLLIKEVGKSSL